jgi:hypothetical protein
MKTVLIITLATLVGAFIGFWTSFGLFFTYPEPLGVWAHPFVWAAGGAIIGLLIASALVRRPKS